MLTIAFDLGTCPKPSFDYILSMLPLSDGVERPPGTLIAKHIYRI
jgi:hypothetical protein